MYVKVLSDNKARRGLKPDEGFSCLVDGKILFDTGEASTSLVENMDRMMVPTSELEGVVLSSERWDHTGGLWEILKRKKGLKVCVGPSFSEKFKKCVEELGGELIVVEEPIEISENIFVTGEIKGREKGEDIFEQALVIKGDKGLSVIAGCSRPGIMNVLSYARDKMGADDMYMVFGGFHLDGMNRDEINTVISDMKALGVKKAGPTHCSGEKARRMFSGQYHDDFVPIKAGHIIHL